jgi:hypothetical protein
MLEHLL